MTQSWLSTDRLRSTPALLRAWSVAITGLLIACAVLTFLAALEFSNSTNEIEDNTGPVLISTQGLVASIAEADAANTAVFLSGADEDRQQRALYDSALDRAPQQIEDISSGIGDDETSHTALKDLAAQLTDYAGVVERARLGNTLGSAAATTDLEESFELVGGPSGMLSNADLVTQRTQDRFDEQVSAGLVLFVAALSLIAVTVLVMFAAQIRLKRSTKRTVNPGLLLGSLTLIGLALWLAGAYAGRTADLDAANDDAYNSIAVTAELQTAAFDYKTREAEAIIRNNASLLPDSTDDIDLQLRILREEADSVRERAAVDALSTRWDRYVVTSEQIGAALASGDSQRATTLAIGDGNRDFNGFNTTVESVLLANRDQFVAAVDSAGHRLRWLQLGAIVLPLLAAAFVLGGYQSRINEYW